LTPRVFAEILSKFADGLPSDAALKFELIQRGFLPEAAEAPVAVLKSSVEFGHYYDGPRPAAQAEPSRPGPEHAADGVSNRAEATSAASVPTAPPSPQAADRIPVRLSGGRRAFPGNPVPPFLKPTTSD
jgi:hypothetical protein